MPSAFAPNTEIYFYDHDGNRVSLLSGWEYLEYSQRVNSPWNYMLRIELSYPDERIDFLRNELVRDYIIEVFRSDEVTGTRELVYEGFHRTIVEQTRQSGSIIFTLYGTGYTHLLTRRIVIPDTGSANKVYSGPAESVLKNFVDSQAVNPQDTARIIPGLTIETSSALGATAEYSARYTNMMTVCTDVAEQGGIDFGIVKGTEVGTFELQARTLWGLDKSQDNGARDPVIFDIFLHNMDIPIRSLSASDEVNVVYVGGDGEGVARTIQEMSTTAKDVSPWNRIEAFVDARRETTSDGLTTSGQSYLNKHEVIDTLSYNVLQTEGTRWLRDWVLGDIVTAKYFNLIFTHKIVQINVVVSAGATGSSQIEVISAEMEQV